MTSRSDAPPSRRGAAFTLIELLLVVMVITILFGLLLAAVRAVQRHTLKAVSRSEVTNLAEAWKQYFLHYQTWPTNFPAHRVDTAVARALQGIDRDPATDAGINPDEVVFMEFARFDEQGRPLNAWGESGRHPRDVCSFYVLFDSDGDNRLLATDLQDLSPLPPPFTNTLYRGVAIWTYDPEETDASGAPKVLGNWMP